MYGRAIGGYVELWKVPMRGGEPVRLAGQPSLNRRVSISPDAKTVAYTYSDSRVTPPRGIALVPLEGEPKITLLDILADSVRWTGDGGSLLYSSTQGGVSNVWERPIAGGGSWSPTLQVRRAPLSICQKMASNRQYNATPPVLMWS